MFQSLTVLITSRLVHGKLVHVCHGFVGVCILQNTFQAVLATDGVNSFVVYNYFDMNWPEFDTSNTFPQV